MNWGAAGFPIVAPSPASCMIWGNLFNLCVFFHLQENSSSYLVGSYDDDYVSQHVYALGVVPCPLSCFSMI